MQHHSRYISFCLRTISLTLLFLSSLLIDSCANRGVGPQGGPKDTIPPVIVKEIPASGTLHFAEKSIVLAANEYIQLDNPMEQVLVSPPMLHPAQIKAVGKHIRITFQDSLRENTTYTIHFGNAICDFNEKVPLPGYTYCFSTGDGIDTLMLCGKVIDAETLNPMPVLVGLVSDLSDSALMKGTFNCATRADNNGYFTISNIHPGRYRIYALQDESRDYLFQPTEPVAFLDTILDISAPADTLSSPLLLFINEHIILPDSTAPDSLMSDSLSIDTLRMDRLSVDSIAADTLVTDALPKKDQPHATLKVLIEPFNELARVQLLDTKDQPIMTFAAQQEGIMMDDLPAGTYYLRLYIDLNNDSTWTTGNILQKRQPEPMYYFPKKLSLKENWDFEETFHWQQLPLTKQKPTELIPTKKR